MSDRHHQLGISKSGDTPTPRNPGASRAAPVRVNGIEIDQSLTQSEAALLDAFRSSADDARVDILAMVQSVAKGSPKQTARPALFVASINGKARVQRKGACNAKS